MTDFLIDLFSDLSEYLINLFTDWNFSYETAEIFKNIINMFLILCVSAISWVIAKWIIVEAVHRVVMKTDNKYDDELVRFKVVEPLSQIFPAIYIYYLIQFAISDAVWVERIRTWCFTWNVFSGMLILMRAIDCIQSIVDQILEEQHRKFSTRYHWRTYDDCCFYGSGHFENSRWFGWYVSGVDVDFQGFAFWFCGFNTTFGLKYGENERLDSYQ